MRELGGAEKTDVVGFLLVFFFHRVYRRRDESGARVALSLVHLLMYSFLFFFQADQLTEEQIAGKTWSIDHRSARALLAASRLDLPSYWIYTFAF